MSLTNIDRRDIVDLYAEGFSLRTIGAAVGCSHELVRIVLTERRVPLRALGGRGALPPLSAEILEDLQTEYGGTATVAQLAEWLGCSLRSLMCALFTLRSRGRIGWSDSIVTLGRPTACRRREHPDRDERILSLVRRRVPYSRVAEAVGVSRNVVAGVVHREKRAAA